MTDVTTGDGEQGNGDQGEAAAHLAWHEQQGDVRTKELADTVLKQFPFLKAGS
ncbi:MAG TPA: hypothetical protein VHW01_16820 [Polyangiaceae bacterium]|nr:hypothetical protein [Polyangiaceae bacterium]